MARTPSYLKGLAETRARAASEVERYAVLVPELIAKFATAQAELEACDLFIRKFSPGTDPSRIPSVQAWQGRYGLRGALKDAIAEHLRACAPAEVSTPALANAIAAKLGLKFPTKEARRAWLHGSVGKQLKRLVTEGLIKRMHQQEWCTSKNPGRWRWKKQRATTMDELRAMAAAAGIGTVEADDIPDGPAEGAPEGVEA